MTAASPTYSPSGVLSLVRYPSPTSELTISNAIGCLVHAFIFKILAKGLISDFSLLLASRDSASTNGIGVIGFDAVSKVLCPK